jgi:hypothetical protein
MATGQQRRSICRPPWRSARGVSRPAQPASPAQQRLTIRQAAHNSGFCEHTLRRAIRSGELRASQPSGPKGRLLIDPADLTAWLNQPAAISTPIPKAAPHPSSGKAVTASSEGLIGERFDAATIANFAAGSGAGAES